MSIYIYVQSYIVVSVARGPGSGQNSLSSGMRQGNLSY